MAEEPALQPLDVISQKRQVPLGELALFFLRLGSTAFGGPAAHVAIMEDELVRRRQWLSREEFLDLLGASNLIPGPSSSELAIHIGYLCAAWRGLLMAGSCFVLPAALMVAGLGWLYVRFGKLPTIANRWASGGTRALLAGGSVASHSAQRPGMARQVFLPGDAAGTEGRHGRHGS